MGLRDEYSRDALFRRPDQEVPDCEEGPENEKEPLSQEDWEIMYSDELYSDVCLIQEFVYDHCGRVRFRYSVEDFCELIREPAKWWQNVDLKVPVCDLWRRLATKSVVDPQAFQVWLEYYIDFY